MQEKRVIPCIVCSSVQQEVLYRRGRHKKKFDTVSCRQCGFVFISPRAPDPSNERIQAFYASGGYRPQNRPAVTSAVIKGNSMSDLRCRRRFEVLRDQNPDVFSIKGEVLDVGANLGHYLGYMKSAGWKAVGCEPDRANAEGGAKHFGVEIQPLLYQFTNFGKARFDLITLSHVLEHCGNAREVLTKVHSDLKENGYLYVELPCIERPYGGDLDRFFWDEHVNYFSKETLTVLLKQQGFAPVHSGHIGSFLWMMARSANPLPDFAPFPCHDFREIKSNLLEAHVRFLRKRLGEEKARAREERNKTAGARLRRRLRKSPIGGLLDTWWKKVRSRS